MELNFNETKCSTLHFIPPGSNFCPHTYNINGVPLSEEQSIKDLGVIVSTDLSWSLHLNTVIAKAYQQLGLIRRSFGNMSTTTTKTVLYLTLVRSKLTYCSQLWRPQYIKNIVQLERVQKRASKFMLNRPDIDYRERLIALNILPLVMWLELQDVLFFIKQVKQPTDRFNILNYVSFCSSDTRSSTLGTLKHIRSRLNKARHFYFSRLPRIWNRLPTLDLTLSITTIHHQLREVFWAHFTAHFQSDKICSYHISCPCSKCISVPVTSFSPPQCTFNH